MLPSFASCHIGKEEEEEYKEIERSEAERLWSLKLHIRTKEEIFITIGELPCASYVLV